MIREPAELVIGSQGDVSVPLGLLAEAGLDPGSRVVAYSDGDGRIILRRAEDAIDGLLSSGEL